MANQKTPGEDLVYGFEWRGDRPWLAPDESIINSDWVIRRKDGQPLEQDDCVAADVGIVNDGETTLVRISGGVVGRVYYAINTVRTDSSPPNTPERTKVIEVVEVRTE